MHLDLWVGHLSIFIVIPRDYCSKMQCEFKMHSEPNVQQKGSKTMI